MKKLISCMMVLCILLSGCGGTAEETVSGTAASVEEELAEPVTAEPEEEEPAEPEEEEPVETVEEEPVEPVEEEPAEPAEEEPAEEEKEFLPVGPVGGEGAFSIDTTLWLVNGALDDGGKATYDSDANCIISICPADGTIQNFIQKYMQDEADGAAYGEELKTSYLSLDNAIRDAVNVNCDTEVDTMFLLKDNEYGDGSYYVLAIQNGELTYSMMDAWMGS